MREADVADLVNSIREQGIIEPLVITPEGTVVCGHRRLLAAKLAGLAEVPVVVRELDEREQLTVMLTENIQRADLSPLQEARAFRLLLDLGLTLQKLARRLGVTPPYAQQRLVILKLDPVVQALFDRRELPVTLARPLAKVADAEMQRRLAARAANRTMTVRQIEETIERGLQSEPPSPRQSSAKSQPTKPGRGSPWPTRREAVAALQANLARRVSLAEVLRIFDAHCGVCAECGLSELELACRECPGPAMMKRLVG